MNQQLELERLRREVHALRQRIAHTWTALVGLIGEGGSGSGDMLKSVYDTDDDGVVDNAETLNSQAGSYYLSRANHTGTQAPATISPQGAGSGLNADTVDGQHAAAFVTSVYHQVVLTIEGANLSSTGVKPLRVYAYVPAGATIQEVYAAVNTAPGTGLTIDVHKNGTTILSGNLTISASNYTAVDTSPEVTTLAKDDYFQLEIVTGDSTAADLTVHVRYRRIYG